MKSPAVTQSETILSVTLKSNDEVIQNLNKASDVETSSRWRFLGACDALGAVLEAYAGNVDTDAIKVTLETFQREQKAFSHAACDQDEAIRKVTELVDVKHQQMLEEFRKQKGGAR